MLYVKEVEDLKGEKHKTDIQLSQPDKFSVKELEWSSSHEPHQTKQKTNLQSIDTSRYAISYEYVQPKKSSTNELIYKTDVQNIRRKQAWLPGQKVGGEGIDWEVRLTYIHCYI